MDNFSEKKAINCYTDKKTKLIENNLVLREDVHITFDEIRIINWLNGRKAVMAIRRVKAIEKVFSSI